MDTLNEIFRGQLKMIVIFFFVMDFLHETLHTFLIYLNIYTVSDNTFNTKAFVHKPNIKFYLISKKVNNICVIN